MNGVVNYPAFPMRGYLNRRTSVLFSSTKIKYYYNQYNEIALVRSSFLLLSEITYVCYHWSSDDKELMSAGASRLDVCEMVPGRKFTDGNNSLTPGCGTCSCCREVLA